MIIFVLVTADLSQYTGTGSMGALLLWIFSTSQSWWDLIRTSPLQPWPLQEPVRKVVSNPEGSVYACLGFDSLNPSIFFTSSTWLRVWASPPSGRLCSGPPQPLGRSVPPFGRLRQSPFSVNRGKTQPHEVLFNANRVLCFLFNKNSPIWGVQLWGDELHMMQKSSAESYATINGQ